MLTHIEFQKRLGSDSSKYAIVILNIKIVNKFGETNEVLLLQGLELVSKLASDFRALNVNLTIGIEKGKLQDCYACKRFRQIIRRNPNVLFFLSVGNEPINLDQPDRLVVPQTCFAIPLQPKEKNQEEYEDAVYLATRCEFEPSHKLLIQIMQHSPSPELQASLVALDRALMLTQLGLQERGLGHAETADVMFEKAKALGNGIVDVDGMIELAMTSFLSNRTDSATTANWSIARELQIDPGYAPVYAERAQVFAASGRFDEAFIDISLAIATVPDKDEYYLLRAAVLHELNRLEVALLDLDQVIRCGRNIAAALAYRAPIYIELQRNSEALADLNYLIQLSPNLAVAYYNRGIIFSMSEQYKDALSDFGIAIRLDPRDAKVYFNRGLTYFNMGLYQDAISDYRTAILLNPGDAKSHINLGNAFYALNRYDEAVASHTTAISLAPTFWGGYFNRAAAYCSLSMFDNALTDYDRAIEIEPSNTQAYSLRGTTYLTLGQYGKALADFLHMVELDSKSAEANFKVGAVYSLLEDYQTSLRFLARATDLGHSGAKDLSTTLTFKLGFEAIQKTDSIKSMWQLVSDYPFLIDTEVDFIASAGKVIEQNVPQKLRRFFSDRLNWLQQVMDLSLALDNDVIKSLLQEEETSIADALVILGSALLELEQFEQAMVALSHAIELDSTNAPAYFYRSKTHFSLEQFQDGTIDAERAIQYQPDLTSSVAEAYFMIAGEFFYANEMQAAFEYCQKAAQLGNKRAELVLAQFRKRQEMAPNSAEHRQQLAFEAFQRAKSIDEMEAVIAEHPMIIESEVMKDFEAVIRQNLPAHRREECSQRLTWLRELTDKIQQQFEKGLLILRKCLKRSITSQTA